MAAIKDTMSLSDSVNPNTYSTQHLDQPSSLQTRCQSSEYNKSSNSTRSEIEPEQFSQLHSKFCSFNVILHHSHSSEILNMNLDGSLAISSRN